MAPAAPLLLLLSSALLSSHLRPSAGRPVLLPSWMDGSGRLQTRRTDDALLLGAAAAGHGTAAGLLLLLLDDGGGVRRSLIRRDPEALRLLTAEADGEEAALRRTTAQLVKRSEGPPLSIDLTFHLLRNMIQMARTESQRKQTQRNRKLLDEVGK